MKYTFFNIYYHKNGDKSDIETLTRVTEKHRDANIDKLQRHRQV